MGDKALGAALLVGAILGLIGYLSLLLIPGLGSFNFFLAVAIIMIIAVGALCVIIAWIGYTLLTTPAPTPPTTPPTPTPTEPTGTGKEKKKA